MSQIATVETNALLIEVLQELQNIRRTLEDIKIDTYTVGEVCHKQITTGNTDE